MQRNEHTGGSHERPVSSAASNGKAEIRIEVVNSGKPALVEGLNGGVQMSVVG